LKPENVLMDCDGYVSLTDYGLGKFLKKGQTTNSFCGTPEYLSPEVIIGTGHDTTNDWWTLGILTYEMIFGIPPFYSKTHN
jgi:serum/glucocorticoid-regulated kinase 2